MAAWWSLVLLLIQYAPRIIEAVKALVDAIRSRNVSEGRDAVDRSFVIAQDMVRSLRSRGDLTDAQKREQAWKDIQMGAKIVGIDLTESDSRTLAELAYKQIKREG